jgi:endonuclease/exonuclease/phosphatase family metal-dependent hydrolase
VAGEAIIREVDLTLLSYNICEGGRGRLDRLAHVIAAARPDVAALLEATPESAEALAAELGREFVFGEGNGSCHVAWLSRLPVRSAENHRLPALAKTLLELQVSWNGEAIRLFAAHLASRHEEDAHPHTGEIAAILGVLRKASGDAHVLVGDFNALQRTDPVGTPPRGVVPRGDAGRLKACDVVDGEAAGASDHLAVRAVFR